MLKSHEKKILEDLYYQGLNSTEAHQFLLALRNKEIILLAKEGLLHKDIALITHCKKLDVSRTCRKVGISRILKIEDNRRIIALYEKGKSIKEIALQFEVSPSAIHGIVHRYRGKI